MFIVLALAGCPSAPAPSSAPEPPPPAEQPATAEPAPAPQAAPLRDLTLELPLEPCFKPGVHVPVYSRLSTDSDFLLVPGEAAGRVRLGEPLDLRALREHGWVVRWGEQTLAWYDLPVDATEEQLMERLLHAHQCGQISAEGLVYLDPEGSVGLFLVFDPRFHTASGIVVGSPAAEALAALCPGCKEEVDGDDGTRLYKGQGVTVGLHYEEEEVYVLEIYGAY